MKISKYILIFILIGILFTSCKNSKTVISKTDMSPLSTAKVIEMHRAATPQFNTLASRVQVEYDDGKKRQSITVSLRMEKDETIWIKASIPILGITLAKAVITPDRVSYYETINRSYFDGDFSLISSLLGVEVDFQKIQAILLGQSIFDLNRKYDVTIKDEKYHVVPKQQPNNFIHSLFINPDGFTVADAFLQQPYDDRDLSVNYEPYQIVSGNYFPSKLQIKAHQREENTHISVTYKRIDLNPNTLSFPFTIPSGYEPIKIEP